MPSSPWSVAVRANVALAPGTQKDAFGRLRTSQPVELFSKALEYDSQALFYEDVLTAGGTSSYNANTVSMDLGVVAPGDAVIRQTRQYIRYRPGKSQQVFVTGNFEGQETGVVKRMGLFDDDTQTESTGDGIFFEVDPTGIWAVRRSSTSGSSVDTRVAQADWNVDKMDGTGPSGQTLDLTKFVVCIFDFGWLGGAEVRWGFVVDGVPIIVHEEFPSNVITTPFMRHPSLPVRWEIVGDAGTTTGSMAATCASVQSEGGFNTLGVKRSADMDTTAVTITSGASLFPLISIRLRSGFLRGSAEPVGFNILADGTDDYHYVVLVNANIGNATSPSWNPVGNSIMEYCVDATDAIVSHEGVLASGYGAGGGGPIKSLSEAGVLTSDVPLASKYDGTPDTLTLAVRCIPGSPNTDFYGSLDWREFY